MYIAGMILAVPQDRKEAYQRWAENGAVLFREYGCIEIVECWEDEVPDGQITDFRRAVAAEEGEKVVFSWQVWPDKATLEAAEARMRDDSRFDIPADIPFDPRRVVLGCFTPLHVMGR